MLKAMLALGLLASVQLSAQKRQFVHPGITYTQADLDRMKAMVEARQEPFYTTYQALLKDSYSQPGNGNYEDITQIKEGRFNATIGSDGRRAHDMALLYHITGNKAYADDAVKRLNRYNHLTNAIMCREYDSVDTTKYPPREYFIRFKDAILALLMPFIILGGIYAGIFTPTESASVACIYALIVSFFVYREMDLKKLYKILVDSCVSSAVVLFVVSMSAPFAWFMTSENIPTMISTAVMSLFNNKYIILLVMNLLLLFLGCFLETQSIILLVTPILLPMASYLGISEIALGLIIIVNTSIGMITPPMAVNLFVATGICKTTIGAVSKKIVPYLLVEFGILLIYTYVPVIFGISFG